MELQLRNTIEGHAYIQAYSATTGQGSTHSKAYSVSKKASTIVDEEQAWRDFARVGSFC